MKIWFNILLILFSLSAFGQDEDSDLYLDDDEVKPSKEQHRELGLDINFYASNLGGSAGGALKYSFVSEQNWAYGPSFRFQRSWFKSLGYSGQWNVFGPGFFVHKRLFNYFFLGSEFEILSNPFTNGIWNGGKKWVPVLLVGGGFSKSFTDGFRLNAGLMYDVIHSPSSPFAQSYFMRKENGVLIPLMYRITFFFTL